MCKNFMESGTCKYGEKCLFAHGRHELFNYKPEASDKEKEAQLEEKGKKYSYLLFTKSPEFCLETKPWSRLPVFKKIYEDEQKHTQTESTLEDEEEDTEMLTEMFNAMSSPFSVDTEEEKATPAKGEVVFQCCDQAVQSVRKDTTASMSGA